MHLLVDQTCLYGFMVEREQLPHPQISLFLQSEVNPISNIQMDIDKSTADSFQKPHFFLPISTMSNSRSESQIVLYPDYPDFVT